MRRPTPTTRSRATLPAAPTIVLCALLAAGIPRLSSSRGTAAAAGGSAAAADPWARSDLVQPLELAKELTGNPAQRPTIVCVGFAPLYRGAHVPGASLHGPAATPEGLADLKTWAGKLPRSANLVVYCGCCPMAECPNVRPAFAALREMGFSHLRLLALPSSLAADWIDKGYPIERGK